MCTDFEFDELLFDVFILFLGRFERVLKIDKFTSEMKVGTRILMGVTIHAIELLFLILKTDALDYDKAYLNQDTLVADADWKLEVLGIDASQNLLIVKGSVPGKPGNLLNIIPSNEAFSKLTLKE